MRHIKTMRNKKEEVIKMIECDEWKKLSEVNDLWKSFEVN